MYPPHWKMLITTVTDGAIMDFLESFTAVFQKEKKMEPATVQVLVSGALERVRKRGAAEDI
jgi:hypothetical protein